MEAANRRRLRGLRTLLGIYAGLLFLGYATLACQVPEAACASLAVGAVALLVSAGAFAATRSRWPGLHGAAVLAQCGLLVPAAGSAAILSTMPRESQGIFAAARVLSIVVPLTVGRQLRSSGIPSLPTWAAAPLSVALGLPFWLQLGPLVPAALSLAVAAAGLCVPPAAPRGLGALDAEGLGPRDPGRGGGGGPDPLLGRVVRALETMVSERHSTTRDLQHLCLVAGHGWGLPDELSVPANVVSHVASFLDSGWHIGGSVALADQQLGGASDMDGEDAAALDTCRRRSMLSPDA